MSNPIKVAVIGAGVSGLTTAKCLMDEGVQLNMRLFGPFSPSQYRIDGPGSWNRALETIKEN